YQLSINCTASKGYREPRTTEDIVGILKTALESKSTVKVLSTHHHSHTGSILRNACVTSVHIFYFIWLHSTHEIIVTSGTYLYNDRTVIPLLSQWNLTPNVAQAQITAELTEVGLYTVLKNYAGLCTLETQLGYSKVITVPALQIPAYSIPFPGPNPLYLYGPLQKTAIGYSRLMLNSQCQSCPWNVSLMAFRAI
ncbi:unnamed protein product, partial [Didymodactylos carnosus]